MTVFFKNIFVEFGNDSREWISSNVEKLVNHHNQNSPINSIVCRLHQYNNSPVANDIRAVLKSRGLTGTNFELFTYKEFATPNLDGGYPHIDFHNGSVIPARINFLLEGQNDKMYWWKHDINSDLILQNDIKTNGERSRLRGYLVDQISNLPRKEMYAQLGNPIATCDNLYGPNSAAVVRTDMLHAVTWTGGPRIILSMQIEESWDEISTKLNA